MKNITLLLIILFSITLITESTEAQPRHRRDRKHRLFNKKNKRKWLFVVNSIARVQSEPSSFSHLVGLLKFKARVRVLAKEDNWFYIQSGQKEITGYIHADSLMPLRKIRRFLKRQERQKIDRDESSSKGFSENEEVSAGAKGFSEQDEVAAGSKGFSETDEVAAGSKGLNKQFETDMMKSNPKYRYDLVDQFIKNNKLLNPYRKLKDFREARKIGEFYKPVIKGRSKKRRSELLKKRFDTKKIKHHDGFLPSEEYYIGRTTAAYLLSKYTPYGDGTSKLEKYLNNLGRVLGMASIRPEVFNGYRIIVIKSDKKNAFATPGGFIFITTGLLNIAKNEDEIASVLAHEVAHVALRHPTKSINQARRQEMLKKLAEENNDGEENQNLTQNIKKSLDDILKEKKTNRDSKMEERADYYAIRILLRLGYNPMGLVRIIKKLGTGDAVHGDPQERANNLKRHIKKLKRRFGLVTKIPKYRRTSYQKILKGSDDENDDE